MQYRNTSSITYICTGRVTPVIQRISSPAIPNMPREQVPNEEEYERNPDLNRDKVKELQMWIHSQSDLPLVTENMVIKFFHSCYYDLEATKKCIKTYYHLRIADNESQLFFGNRDVSRPEMIAILDAVQFGLVPEKDRNGYQIIFHRLQQFEPSKYVFHDSAKCLGMGFDYCLAKYGTQKGFVALFDMKGVRLGHLLRLNVSSLKKFFTYVQEGIPVRLKAIHVVNTLPIIDKVMFMIRPFMKRDLIKMIHFHSSDYEEVQKYIPKYCLPSDFGGDSLSVGELHDNYKKAMLEMKDDFLEEEQFLRDQKNKNLNGLQDLKRNSSSISTIEFD